MGRLSTSALFTASWLVMVACGCVISSEGQSGDEALKGDDGKANQGQAKDAGARVQSTWQDKMLEMLKAEKATEAWGLFSSGGWSNSGQILVFMTPDRAVRRVVIVQPNKKEIGVDRALTDAELKSLEPAMTEAPKLEDVDVEMFDGLEFELVHATKDKGDVKVVDRLLLRDPGGTPRPKHQAVIQAFERLRKP